MKVSQKQYNRLERALVKSLLDDLESPMLETRYHAQVEASRLLGAHAVEKLQARAAQ